jgi:hypothetical protein
MTWEQIRQDYPDQWLLLEARQATTVDGKRVLLDLIVLGTFADSAAALHQYAAQRRQEPASELYVFHTSRATLDIEEHHWLGIRVAQ